MRRKPPVLLSIYEQWLHAGDLAEPLAAARVAARYSASTLMRMAHSHDPQVRRSACWGLGWIGDQRQFEFLGPFLQDPMRGVRTAADEARHTIESRTQCPWHRRCAARIEDLLVAAQLPLANALATELVEETDRRSDAYLLRAWIRFCSGELVSATEDCKRTLSIDPYCYRACVALGQCFWHQNRDAAARECFYESLRIYPDWEPAATALRTMQGSRSAA